MTAWKGRTRGGATGYQIFIWILTHLGLDAAYLILRLVALYYFFFVPASFRVMYTYFHKVLGFGKWASIARIYRNYYVFGQVILDKFALLGGLKDRFTYDFDKEAYLRKMVEEQTGGILISGHIGNWEVAGAFLNRLGGRINIVVYDGELERIKRLTERTIDRGEVNFIAIKPDFSHIFHISKALKNKELICIHGDRFLPGARTVKRNFLGYPARFPLGPFELAARFEVPCSFVFAMRGKGKHYHFSSTPGKVYGPQPEVILDDFLRVFEAKVHQYPNQWFNYYEFWEKEVYESGKNVRLKSAVPEALS
ncbi:MAG: lipid A biosynthesis acyltransferase [Bacteroidetes bacterium]|nr:MAG: lipid A biosynthesis acyltransferase [Bacteroidota bacterium]